MTEEKHAPPATDGPGSIDADGIEDAEIIEELPAVEAAAPAASVAAPADPAPAAPKPVFEAIGASSPEAAQEVAEPAAGGAQEAVEVDATERLEALLTELADIARTSGMRSLSSEITSERLPALREGRVTVVVLGEFNHGKSTIINALLGGPVLPMGITPTTAVITHLVWSDKPRAVVHYDDNDREEVAVERLPELVAQDQRVEPKFVEVGYPSELLRDNLVLVDTPGVNDISQQRVEITYGYLPRADVILYVLDANQVLKKSEITFIQNRLLRGSLDRLLFVLGKIDTLSDDEREEVESYAREKLAELIGPVELYPLSARNAMKGGDPGFEAFQANLRRYLKDRKSFILVDSGVSGGLRVASMLEQNLAIKRRGYALDRHELERRVESVRKRVNDARRLIHDNLRRIDETTLGMKATARHNLAEFTERFAEALPAEIDRATPGDIQKFLPDFIRDTYKGWLEDEGNSIARELERLAQEVIETTNQNLGEAVDAVQDELGLEAGTLDLKVDTTPYDVGVWALGAAGVSVAVFGSIIAGGLLLLAAPVLAFVIKDKAEARVKDMAREGGVRAIREAGLHVEAEMHRMIEGYGEQLRSFVESAGERLYRQVNEALGQVMSDTADVGADREALDRVAAGAEADVERVVAGLHEVRRSLLAGAGGQHG